MSISRVMLYNYRTLTNSKKTSEMDKRQTILQTIDEEATRIFNSPYTLEGRDALKSLEKCAWKLCREGDVPGQNRRLEDLNTEEVTILLLLQRMTEEYIGTAGNDGQPYTEDMELSVDDIVPLGFHKAYFRPQNLAIIKNLNYLTVFPHYCFSFYDLSSGKLIDKVSNDGPNVFRLPDCYNFGKNSFFTIWEEYMLFMGWPDSILYDMELLIQSTEKNRTFGTGNDMITDLDSLCYKISGDKDSTEYYEQLNGMRRAFLEIQAHNDHESVSSAIGKYPVSIAISPEGRKKIKNSADDFLTPMCQVPFGLGGYHHILEQEYGYSAQRVSKLKLLNRGYQMFAIKSGLYGHESRVVYNAATGIITGKIVDIKNVLPIFDDHNLLCGSDLRYMSAL